MMTAKITLSLFYAVALALAFAIRAQAADLYVFSPDAKTPATAPRELPSCAVRLDNAKPVLGLHAAAPEVKAACGWYRVAPSAVKAATNQYIAARSYAIAGTVAQESVTLAAVQPRPVQTTRQRIDAIFSSLDSGLAEDAKIRLVIAEVAAAVTNRLAAPRQEAAAK